MEKQGFRKGLKNLMMSIKFKSKKKYRNGESILNITNNAEWIPTSNGAWYYYNNDNNYF